MPNCAHDIASIPTRSGSGLAHTAVVVAQPAFEGMTTPNARVQNTERHLGGVPDSMNSAHATGQAERVTRA